MRDGGGVDELEQMVLDLDKNGDIVDDNGSDANKNNVTMIDVTKVKPSNAMMSVFKKR